LPNVADLNRCEVAIVGGGFSGLACAKVLADAGVDFQLIEATGQLGGRARTNYSVAPGFPAELGALMVHGRKVVTHDWIRAHGLSARRLPTMQQARFCAEGRVSSLRGYWLPFRKPFGPGAFLEGAYRLPRLLRAHANGDLSVAAFLDRRHASPGGRMLVTLLHCHAYAADPEEIGVLGQVEEERFATERFGFANFQLREGYSELARRSAMPLLERIRLQTQVTDITWTPSGVTLELLRRGEPQSIALEARYVVITVPLGVLKRQTIRFDPPLPEAKRKAIERLGFGDGFSLQMRLGKGDLRRALGDFAQLWADGPTTFHRPVVGLGAAPELLTAFTVGQEARRRAHLPDSELLAATLDELRTSLPPRLELGTVEAWAVHRWTTDPFFGGAYSYFPPGAGLGDRRVLAEPVDSTLCFAGEATHTLGESATVHGAIDTGIRAAKEVLRFRSSAGA